MGVWKKSPQIAPEEHARIQAAIDANPEIATLKDQAWGNTKAWTAIPGQIRQIMERNGTPIPDGYDVDMNGTLVYTNKTPLLQQLAWASLPIGSSLIANGLLGGAAATAGEGTAAPSGVLASTPVAPTAGHLFGAPLAAAVGTGTANAATTALTNSTPLWQQAIKTLAPLTATVAPALLASGSSSTTPQQSQLEQEVMRLLALQRQRQESQQPLFDQTNALVQGLLPKRGGWY